MKTAGPYAGVAVLVPCYNEELTVAKVVGDFTRVLPGGEKLGAYHAAEIGYVFGNRMAWLPHEPVDDTLSDAMAGYWTQFAATGNPNRNGLPEWPAYAATTDQHLELGSEVKVGSGLVHEACDVVDQGLRAQWQTGGTK